MYANMFVENTPSSDSGGGSVGTATVGTPVIPTSDTNKKHSIITSDQSAAAPTALHTYARDGYPSAITFLAGATAAMTAAVCTHPFDVLKTRQQVAAWHVNSNNNLAVAAGNISENSTAGKLKI